METQNVKPVGKWLVVEPMADAPRREYVRVTSIGTDVPGDLRPGMIVVVRPQALWSGWPTSTCPVHLDDVIAVLCGEPEPDAPEPEASDSGTCEDPMSYTCPSCEEGQVTRMTSSPGRWTVAPGIERRLPADIAVDTCERCHAIFVNEDEALEIEALVEVEHARERSELMRRWVEDSQLPRAELAKVCGGSVSCFPGNTTRGFFGRTSPK